MREKNENSFQTVFTTDFIHTLLHGHARMTFPVGPPYNQSANLPFCICSILDQITAYININYEYVLTARTLRGRQYII